MRHTWWKWTLKQISFGINATAYLDTEVTWNPFSWTLARHVMSKFKKGIWCERQVFKKVEWRHLGDFYASVVIQKTYGEIPNGQFTFERKRRRINCLTKKVTFCFSTPYVCLDKFWLNNLWLLLFGSPKHYFLLVCFSVSFSNLAVHDTLTQQFVVTITSLHCIALVLHTHLLLFFSKKSKHLCFHGPKTHFLMPLL